MEPRRCCGDPEADPAESPVLPHPDLAAVHQTAPEPGERLSASLAVEAGPFLRCSPGFVEMLKAGPSLNPDEHALALMLMLRTLTISSPAETGRRTTVDVASCCDGAALAFSCSLWDVY